MGNKPITISIENYKEIIDKSCYYVNKIDLIRELFDKGGKVTFLPNHLSLV